MSIKQIYLDAGVSHAIPVYQLWQSWPISMKAAEATGLQVRPVKIGSRRVVLATDDSFRKKPPILPICAILLVLASGIVALIPHEVPRTQMRDVKAKYCAPMEIGTPIRQQAGEFIAGEWSLSLSSTASSGNIERFDFEATCQGEKIAGVLTAGTVSGAVRIKKLTPAK